MRRTGWIPLLRHGNGWPSLGRLEIGWVESSRRSEPPVHVQRWQRSTFASSFACEKMAYGIYSQMPLVLIPDFRPSSSRPTGFAIASLYSNIEVCTNTKLGFLYGSNQFLTGCQEGRRTITSVSCGLSRQHYTTKSHEVKNTEGYGEGDKNIWGG